MNWLNKKLVSLTSVDLSYAFLSYGIDTILVIYLIKILKVSDFEALSSLSVRSCLIYSLPVLTAFISNYWISKELIVGIGLILMSSGLILLGISGQTSIVLSLSCLTVGYVLGRPLISVILGKIVPVQRNPSIIRAFHALSDVACILAPLVFSITLYGEKNLFIILGSGGLCVCLIYVWQFLSVNKIVDWVHFTLALSVIIGFVVTVYYLLKVPKYLKYIFFMSLVMALIYGFQLFKNKNSEDLRRLKHFFLLIVFSTLFFIFFSQQFFFMPLFIEKYVDFHIGGFKVPTPWFSMINPFTNIILAPFIIYFTKDIKFSGFIVPSVFLLAGFGFLILLLGLLFPALLVITIILTYCLFTISDLLLVPLILSIVSTWNSEKEKSILMGYLYLSMAFSKILAPKIALWIDFPTQLTKSVTHNPYILPIFTIGVGLLIISFLAKTIFYKKALKISG